MHWLFITVWTCKRPLDLSEQISDYLHNDAIAFKVNNHTQDTGSPIAGLFAFGAQHGLRRSVCHAGSCYMAGEMSNHKALDDLAASETIAFQQRQSLAFLECAVNLLCVDYNDNLAFVIRRLRELAQHLEDHS
jgi:hypothetical protein